MKLVMAVLKDDDIEEVIHALTAQGFRATRVASTGGFFRKGSTTLLIGVQDNQVDTTIQVLREKTTVVEEGEKRGTVFVIPIEHYEQL